MSFAAGSQLREIGDRAFYRCGQAKVSLPDGLERIGFGAFECSELKALYVPASVREIAPWAFHECGRLCAVSFATDSRLRRLGRSAFEESGSLVVALPEGLEEVPEACFYRSGVRKVYIPASVRRLGGGVYDVAWQAQTEFGAFQQCAALREVSFAAGSRLEEVGGFCFHGTALAALALPATVARVGPEALPGGARVAWAGPRPAGELTPEAVRAQLERQGGGRAFAVPEGTTELGPLCFCNSGVERVEVPASVRVVDCYAFSGCRGLREVAFAGAPRVRTYAFTEQTRPETLAFASARQFEHFRRAGVLPLLTKALLPPDLDAVPRGAFARGHLREIAIPASVRRIGCGARAFCLSGIRQLRIPVSLEEIGRGAFRDCKRLQNVSLAPGARLRNVGAGAFGPRVNPLAGMPEPTPK